MGVSFPASYYNVGDPEAPDNPILIDVLDDQGIYEGEEYYESDKGPISVENLKQISAMEFLEFLGERFETAEKEAI